jgi:hypothetical protein
MYILLILLEPEEENGQKKLKMTHANTGSPTSPPNNLALAPSSPPNSILLLPYHNNESQQESHSSISTSKQNNTPLPGLHITLAEIAGTLAPIHLPPLESPSPHPKSGSYPKIQPPSSNSPNHPISSSNQRASQNANTQFLSTNSSTSSYSNSSSSSSANPDPVFSNSSSHSLYSNSSPNSLSDANPNPDDVLNSNINLYSSFYIHNQN